jgi:hypothetical protein
MNDSYRQIYELFVNKNRYFGNEQQSGILNAGVNKVYVNNCYSVEIK